MCIYIIRDGSGEAAVNNRSDHRKLPNVRTREKESFKIIVCRQLKITILWRLTLLRRRNRLLPRRWRRRRRCLWNPKFQSLWRTEAVHGMHEYEKKTKVEEKNCEKMRVRVSLRVTGRCCMTYTCRHLRRL